MSIDPNRTSKWMVEFAKALDRCKQVILHGNVGDQFLLNGEYLTAGVFLRRYFRDAGYEVVAEYDVADGVAFDEPRMRPRFEQIVREGMGVGPAATPQSAQQQVSPGAPTAQAAPPPAQPGQPPAPSPPPAPAPQPSGPPPAPPAPGAPPPRGVPGAPPRGTPGAPGAPGAPAAPSQVFLQEPDKALAQIRIALAQDRAATAFVLRFADKLVTNPESQPINERQCLVNLVAAVENAGFVREGPLAGRRNVLVITARALGSVPPWIYQDNPFFTLVQMARPSHEERQNFIQQFLPNFHGGTDVPQDQVAPLGELFADLTDDLSAWDLDAVRRTSIAESIPISKTRELIAYFKHGARDDPWEKLDGAKVEEARQILSKRVIGQPAAVDAVVSMLLSAKVGITMSPVTAAAGKPKGVFFFVGPTGVGKTELAKSLSEAIFSDESAFARFDMSEYAEQHAAEKLTGAPPGFVGYEEGGHLTNRVRDKPFSLLLFDEIEKAHPKIMDKFLQILEDGRLTDGQGQTAYFNQSVIIFTSNIGSSTLDVTGESVATMPYQQVHDHFLHAVREHFTAPPRMDGSGGLGRPELLNRLGEGVVVFDILRVEHVRGIAGKFLSALADNAKDRLNLDLAFDESVLAWICETMQQGDNLVYGGRRIKVLIEADVERPLNRWVFFHDPSPGTRLELGFAGDPLVLTVNGTPSTAQPEPALADPELATVQPEPAAQPPEPAAPAEVGT